MVVLVVVVVAVVAGVPFPLTHPLPFPHHLALLCQSEISIHSPTSTFFPIRSSPAFSICDSNPPPPSATLSGSSPPSSFQSTISIIPSPSANISRFSPPLRFSFLPTLRFQSSSNLHPLFPIPSSPTFSICDFNPAVFL